MSKISLCMIVKNEEKVLERCLESVKEIVDEIIIVDTGSEDRTKEIARQYTTELYDFEWCNDFSKARNYAIEKATGEMILVLDADEELEDATRDQLESFIQKFPDAVGRVSIKNIFIQEGSYRVSYSNMVRFFPKGLWFEGKAHECIKTTKKREDMDIIILHDGYMENNKVDRNLPLLLEELESVGPTSYLLYQIGKQYKLKKAFEMAAEYYIQSYEGMNGLSELRGTVVIDLLYVLLELKLYDTALEFIELEEKNTCTYADFYFVKGLIWTNICADTGLVEQIFLDEIEKAYKNALKLGIQGEKIVKGTGTYLAAYNIGIYYELLGKFEEAKKYSQLSNSYNPDHFNIKPEVAIK